MNGFAWLQQTEELFESECLVWKISWWESLVASGLTLWLQRLHAVGLHAPGNALLRVRVRGSEADHPVGSTHDHRVAQLVCVKNTAAHTHTHKATGL